MDLNKYFERFFTKETVFGDNNFLGNEILNDEQKINLLSILAFLDDGRGLKVRDGNIILFNDFCSDSENINNKYFNRLLDTINHLILDNKEYDKLKSKIVTIFHGRKSKSEFSIDEYYELLFSILNMKRFEHSQDNHKVISNLLANPIEGYPEKTKQAIEIALNNKVSVPFFPSGNDCKYVDSILRNKLILELDDVYFEKAVKIAYSDIQAALLSKAISKEGITEGKIKAIIDYYNAIFSKYLGPYSNFSDDIAKEKEKNRIFNVVISDKFMEMDDETYKKSLDRIRQSNEPFSLACVLSNDELTVEQEKILSNFLEKVTVDKNGNKNFIDDICNYKDIIIAAAHSPVLMAQSPVEYQRVLKIVDGFLIDIVVAYESLNKQETSDVFQNNTKQNYLYLNKVDLLRRKNKGLLMLLGQKRYIENYELFNYFLNKVISTDQDTIEESCEFASHDFTRYYSDDEIKRIFDLILKSRYCCCNIKRLFINDNVPCMSTLEKMNLFTIAESDDKNKLLELEEELLEKGRNSNNKKTIPDGVNDSSVKKLELNYANRLLKH